MSLRKQNILLLGAGGRECTLAWKLQSSPLCGQLYIAPGNAGTSAYGTNLPISVKDFDGIRKACIDLNIDIILPGPEDPLVAGIYDFVKADPVLQHIIVAGPSANGAQLEGSKTFSKKFMERHHIPTAAYREFTADNYAEGEAYIANHPTPVVIKADGLAAGKGVVIAATTEEALDAYAQGSKRLNDSQKEAFRKALQFGPLSLLQGPPGTGKTWFIASLLHYLVTKEGARRILVVSQAHEAVNNALEKALELFEVALQRSAVRGGLEEVREPVDVMGGQIVVTDLAGDVQDGGRPQPAVEMVVQEGLGRLLDQSGTQRRGHPSILLAASPICSAVPATSTRTTSQPPLNRWGRGRQPIRSMTSGPSSGAAGPTAQALSSSASAPGSRSAVSV